MSELFDGDTKKFVNDILVGRQHYLKRDRVQGPDPEVRLGRCGQKIGSLISRLRLTSTLGERGRSLR